METALFDCHCDTATMAMDSGEKLFKNTLHIDLERGMNYSPYAQVFAIFTRPEDMEITALSDFHRSDSESEVLYTLYSQAINFLHNELWENSDKVELCLSANDARKAADSGKIAAFISVEGAELLCCDLAKLRLAYNGGVRILNLCWNFDNELCAAALGKSQKGLSERGRAFVIKAQEMGVMLDMSHASERTFWDVLDIAKKPVIASHSNARAICNHPRNLTDSQFAALARAGGVAGLNLCPAFICEDEDRADIDSAVSHIEHFLSLGGEGAVSIGSDFDGIDSCPKGISGIEDLGKIYDALLRRNYSESLVSDIFYNNMMNTMEAVI